MMMLAELLLNCSRLTDCDTKIRLISPLAVVVWSSALGLACQAPPMLLLDNAAVVVEGDACVLLSARIVRHPHHAFLVLHNMWIRTASAGVLLDNCLKVLACAQKHAGLMGIRCIGSCVICKSPLPLCVILFARVYCVI